MKAHRIAAAGMALAIGFAPATASAQAWIGLMVGQMMAEGQAYQQEIACMSGTPMIDKEVLEARQPAIDTMTGYYAAAQAGKPLTPSYNLDKRSRWISGDVTAEPMKIDAQRDPFAAPGHALTAEPLGYARAGDGQTVWGQWAVTRDGARAGTYTGVFTRKDGRWKLRTLTLTPASQYADPVVQFCHKPGDVMPYRLVSTRSSREIFEKRLAKTEAKLAKAQAAKPSPEGAARIADLTKQVEARRTEVEGARTAEAKAIADNKAAEDAKAAAIAALPAAS